MKIAHSERLLKAARDVLRVWVWGLPVVSEVPSFEALAAIIDEIDRDQRDGQP